MTTTTNESPIDLFREVSEQIANLKAERSKISVDLRSAGIHADEETRQELQAAAVAARQTLAGIDQQIRVAEAEKAHLDAAVDAGDDSVDDMALFKAGTTIRRLNGKRKPAAAEVQKAEAALKPFEADDELALLAAETFEDLVDVPVLVRKRARDVKGVGDAIVISQTEPIKGFGTFRPSGRVRFTESGNTGLDLDVLENALRETGSEVFVTAGLIDFEQAQWPTPRLVSPSRVAVVEFADVLARTFQATVEGPALNRGYSTYKTVWKTLEASLDVTEPGVAVGKVIADFAIEKEFPPTAQMRSFIAETLSHFDTGVHTSAGSLDSIELVDVAQSGKWIEDDYPVSGRAYPGKFQVIVDLRFTYEPVGV